MVMIEYVEGVKITMAKDEISLPHVHANYRNYHGIFSL